MYLPLLHPISNSHFYVSGNVTIDPNAAIAPGVLLQADPDSQIIIAAGACIGMGSILHANQGIVEVEAGVIIGTGVLIVGKGKIGANACIGSMTTIWNSSIERGGVVAPGSLIGDTSRQLSANQTPEATEIKTSEVSSNQQAHSDSQLAKPEAATPPVTANTFVEQQTPEAVEGSPTQAYGQASLNRLLSTLLPHRQALNRPHQEP